MTRLILVDFKTMDRLLRQLGFAPLRQKGRETTRA
jgi:predicted RNA binding protein YcfA (HicA-like mRNA interferase family)